MKSTPWSLHGLWSRTGGGQLCYPGPNPERQAHAPPLAGLCIHPPTGQYTKRQHPKLFVHAHTPYMLCLMFMPDL